MGCCMSKGGTARSSRAVRWRSTGIVALRDSKLRCLPNEVLELERAVRTLDATHNKLVGLLVRLERLSVSQNLLATLPETIGSLRNLVQLNISNNRLRHLPDSIGSCFSLEELLANENLIEVLPVTLCLLVNLKSLALSANKLNQLPRNLLKDCTSLQSLSLHENPISMEQFQEMEGFEEFESRRKRKFDKQIDSNVMISSTGLDEGVDL